MTLPAREDGAVREGKRPKPDGLGPELEAEHAAAPTARGQYAAELAPQGDRLPDEIAFLEQCGVAPETLRRAAETARASGVPADRALLTQWSMSAQEFYEKLARHLGVPYLRRPLPVASGIRLDQAVTAEVLPLAPNPEGLDYVLSPRGENLAQLLRLFAKRPLVGQARVGITSPQRLAALVRLHHRQTILREASHSLSDMNTNLSARSGWSLGQRVVAFGFGLSLAAGLGFAPVATAQAVCLLFSLLFLGMVVMRLWAAAWSVPATLPETPVRTPDDRLPVYTVVVPVYRESQVVPRLVKALKRLDYPAARLDIKIMVEANDAATIDALQVLHLPEQFEILMAPAGQPQTKPRALNVALQFARGRFLVVYDAEDEPEPDQLRAAVAAFRSSGPKMACLQGRLAIDNHGDSWLTRLFALEYASLFDVINPGLARLGLPIPLGGTSNHFRIEALRHVNGWDAWNVTEDIDLGIRLARFGYEVGMLQSATYEEAPHRMRAWLSQRRRWQKGWFITLRTHSRDPARLFADLGPRNGTAAMAMLCGTIASSVLGPLFLIGVALDAAFGPLLAPRTPLEAAWSGLALTLMVLGVASAVWPIWLGSRRRGLLPLLGWTALLPLYFGLLSLASWQAFAEMFWRPYAWAKTEHGVAKNRKRLGKPV